MISLSLNRYHFILDALYFFIVNMHRLLEKLIPAPSFLPVVVTFTVARHPELEFPGVMLQFVLVLNTAHIDCFHQATCFTEHWII